MPQLRIEAIKHYSKGKMCCEICGENHLECLCIDHIKGGGGKHRKSINGHIYAWLKRNNFPEGFRILCHNCNMSIAFYGYSPYEQK